MEVAFKSGSFLGVPLAYLSCANINFTMVKKCVNPSCLKAFANPTTPGCNCEMEGLVLDGKFVGAETRERFSR